VESIYGHLAEKPIYARLFVQIKKLMQDKRYMLAGIKKKGNFHEEC